MGNKLTESEIAEHLLTTREEAKAAADDLKYMRRVVGVRRVDAGDLRRLSGQLRRLLPDGGLARVAQHRVALLEIVAPQLRGLHRSHEEFPYLFCFGGELRFNDGYAFGDISVRTAEMLTPIEAERTVKLRISQFSDQRVVCFNGRWVKRSDIIKYVANSAHGVHSNADPTIPALALLREMRNYAGIKFHDDLPPTIIFDVDQQMGSLRPIEDLTDIIDIAHMQLMSTIQYLVESPSVIQLVRIIEAE